MHEYNFNTRRINQSLFCRVGQRSSFLFLIDDQHFFETFHDSQHFSEISLYDQTSFLISPTYHHHYWKTSFLPSLVCLCSSLAFLYDQCSFYSLQIYLYSFEAAQTGLYSFGNCIVATETSLQLL